MVTVIVALLLVFNGLVRADNHLLLAMMVMATFVGAAWYYLRESEKADVAAERDLKTKIESDGRPSGRVETTFPGNRILAPSFPKKGFKYLIENHALVEIAEDIRVLRLIDHAKYSDILVLMNQLQKTYMYILAGRYNPSQYIPIFVDIRDSLLEHFYNMVFVMPTVFQHVYGIDPGELVDRNTGRVTAVTRKMADVLKSFAEKTAELAYVPDVIQVPAPNDFRDPTSTMRLP
jgi:hypothetical protein